MVTVLTKNPAGSLSFVRLVTVGKTRWTNVFRWVARWSDIFDFGSQKTSVMIYYINIIPNIKRYLIENK